MSTTHKSNRLFSAARPTIRGMILAPFIALAPITAPFIASAQDQQGNDRPSNWVATHYQSFGQWDSVCDERPEDGTLTQRCYIRYVEVYSPRPNFGALFVFITPDEIEIGIERGVRLDTQSIRIEQADDAIWRETRIGCLSFKNCHYEGDERGALLDALGRGQTLAFDFTDSYGTEQALRWDLSNMAQAIEDFQAQSTARGL